MPAGSLFLRVKAAIALSFFFCRILPSLVNVIVVEVIAIGLTSFYVLGTVLRYLHMLTHLMPSISSEEYALI